MQFLLFFLNLSKNKIMKLRLIISFFLLMYMIVDSQYSVAIDPNYSAGLGQTLTFASVKNTATPQGYAYFYGTYSGGGNFYLRRYLPTGSLDTSFGNNGTSNSVLPFNGPIVANDQSFFLANELKIAKYNVNGSLDTSFGTGGYFNFNYSGIISKMHINDDLTLMVCKSNVLKKFTVNGQLDSSFTEMPAYSYEVTNSGIIVRPSAASSEYKKYNVNGVQDMTFGTGGIANMTGDFIRVNKNTGEIFAYSSQYPIKITKYTANGILDTSFGNAGTVMYNFPINPSIYNQSGTIAGIEFDSTDKIYAYGGSSNGVDSFYKTAFIIRFTPNGIADTSFYNGSSLFYRQGPQIIEMKILNDNTYLCFNTWRVGFMNNVSLGTTQYVRRLGFLSTNELSTVSENVIYPNPVKDNINISLSSNEKLEYAELFDVSGKLLRKILSVKSNVSDLEAGVYILRIKTNKKEYQMKLIKE